MIHIVRFTNNIHICFLKIKHRLYLLIANSIWWLCRWGEGYKFKLIRPISYDEKQVPNYKLPDLLLCSDGTKVGNVEQWENKRRPELLSLFSEYVYGKVPEINGIVSWDILCTHDKAISGKAIRRDVRVFPLPNHSEIYINLQIYLPNVVVNTPFPVFLAIGLMPNYTVCNDLGVEVPDYIMVENGKTKKAVKRGYMSDFWQLDKILERGYGLATFCHQDLAPDTFNGFRNGVPSLFYTPGMANPNPNDWGGISFWAWQMSRVMDYLCTDKDIDSHNIIAIGHSRLGKAALWAAAQDQRFAIAISNNSGCGGAAISRRCFGETIDAINQQFPQWFCGNFKQFNNREEFLPIDQHELIALLAPRPVYIASAEEDRWSDPKGEFLGGREASPVYHLYGLDGLEYNDMPKAEHPINSGYIGYHIRRGKHTMTDYDWEQFLNFVDKHLNK